MALSTPVDIGSNQNTGAVTSIAITLTTAVSAGNAVVVFVAAKGGSANPTFPTCTDTAGNTYTGGTTRNANLGAVRSFYCVTATALSVGNTITLSGITDVSNGLVASACKIPTPPVLFDRLCISVSSINTTPLMSTGALVGPSSLSIMADYVEGGHADGYTQDVNWTSLTSVLNTTSLDALRPSYRIIAGTASVNHQSTLGTSRAWATTGVAFRELITATGGGTLSMMGV